MSNLALTDDIAAIDGWRIWAPERGYDFERFSVLPRITSIAMRLLLEIRSTNRDVLTQKTSNSSNYKSMCAFLKFCISDQHDGNDELTPDLLHAYIAYQEKHLGAQTAFHVNWLAKRLFEFAFAEGSAASFSMPRSPSRAAIKLAQKPAPTLADSVADLPAGIADRVALNRLLIDRLHEYCWFRIHQVRDRYELAQRWRTEPFDVGVKRSWKKILPYPDEHVSREEAVEIIVKLMWHTSNGFMPRDVKDITTASLERAKIARTRIAIGRFLKQRTFEPALLIEELTDYLYPAPVQLAPFMVILAMVGLDPTPILRLERSCIVDSVEQPDAKNFIWVKERHGGEHDIGPLEIGGRNAQTVPRAVTILDAITAGLRDHAPAELRGYMFLQASDDDTQLETVGLCGTDASNTMRVFRRALHQDATPQFDILRQIKGNVSLKAVRTTVGSLKTYKGGPVAAQEFFKHDQLSTTIPYIDNDDYKRYLEGFISKAQSQLVTHLSQTPTMVLSDLQTLIEDEGLAPVEAQALIAGELENGVGISLINGRSIVFDDPLVYLRMQGWLAVLEAAAKRLQLENLQRWETYWLEQIALFRQTLDDFSRVTRARAAEMSPPDFVYPEPH